MHSKLSKLAVFQKFENNRVFLAGGNAKNGSFKAKNGQF